MKGVAGDVEDDLGVSQSKATGPSRALGVRPLDLPWRKAGRAGPSYLCSSRCDTRRPPGSDSLLERIGQRINRASTLTRMTSGPGDGGGLDVG